MKKTARGIRNNNPLNIDRHPHDKWQGMAADQSSDARFIVFKTAQYGIRAGAVTLLTYKNKYYLNTIKKIINRWAPPGENNTSAYANTVAERSGFGLNDVIDVDSVAVIMPIIKAMIEVEDAGYHYPDSVILEALHMAGIKDALAPAPIKKPSFVAQLGGGVVMVFGWVGQQSGALKGLAGGLKDFAGSPFVDHAVMLIMGVAAGCFIAGVVGQWLQHERAK